MTEKAAEAVKGRKPRHVAKHVLLGRAFEHYTETGELISLNKACGLVGKTTGYGYQLYPMNPSNPVKPGPAWRVDLMVYIVNRDSWIGSDNQPNVEAILRSLQMQWQIQVVAEAIAVRLSDLDAHLASSPAPLPVALPRLVWDAVKSMTEAPRRDQ